MTPEQAARRSKALDDLAELDGKYLLTSDHPAVPSTSTKDVHAVAKHYDLLKHAPVAELLRALVRQRDALQLPQRTFTEEQRAAIAVILEDIAENGLPCPRSLDVALDAIQCTISD